MRLGCSSWSDVSIDPCKPGMIFLGSRQGLLREDVQQFLHFATLINVEGKKSVEITGDP